jgi:DNA-binding CsgD family transcriptional regulator
MLNQLPPELTKRHKEVLLKVVEGNTSQQIADGLGLSIHTVRNHRKSILKRTGCSNIAELMRWSMRNNMIK